MLVSAINGKGNAETISATTGFDKHMQVMSELHGLVTKRSDSVGRPQYETTIKIKPNLFVIGSMKSGTTLLWRLLASHPEIHMSKPKEPCYFVEPAQLRPINPWLWSQGYCLNQEAYLKLFNLGKNKAYAGEASVYYTFLPLVTGVAERIRRFNPNARLIYIMRDPIERTISHYWHRVIYNDECRSMLSAITEDPRYCNISYYAMQLRPYYERYEGNQIKLITLEELIDNYEGMMESIFAWLDIDGDVAMPQLTPENETPNTLRQRTMLWGAIIRFFKRHQFLHAPIALLPNSIKNYGRQTVSREINRLDVDVEPVVQFLRPLQQEQTKELSALTGRSFREWKTLYP